MYAFGNEKSHWDIQVSMYQTLSRLLLQVHHTQRRLKNVPVSELPGFKKKLAKDGWIF